MQKDCPDFVLQRKVELGKPSVLAAKEAKLVDVF